MERVTPDRHWPLFGTEATRQFEQQASATLAPHALMQRAGLAVARLALAVAPHARTIWVACGPGNNGGDGLEAAVHLKQWGKEAIVTWLGDEATAPADALASLRRARAAGVMFTTEPPVSFQLAIDAMLGIGSKRPLQGALDSWAAWMRHCGAPVLSIDVPSGLDADTGRGAAVQAAHTLSLLTLKPGLYTAGGRDACGTVWLDTLQADSPARPTAWLAGPPAREDRPHDSHKGSYGDVAVAGGAPGMTGAALLAASAALHAGAGRVLVALLDGGTMAVDAAQPELMFRSWNRLELGALHLACGCGGGDAVRAILPKAISGARSLVLDADALNALAADSQLQALLQARTRRGGRPTVLTPHPLEAARLLGCATAQVQADRLGSAQALALRLGCTVVLKGSGTVTTRVGEVPVVNPTGNARLSTAGTGDVLAGLVAARLAAGAAEFKAATDAVYTHGLAAQDWPAHHPLTAGKLARRC